MWTFFQGLKASSQGEVLRIVAYCDFEIFTYCASAGLGWGCRMVLEPGTETIDYLSNLDQIRCASLTETKIRGAPPRGMRESTRGLVREGLIHLV